ncbi:cobyric acid synthase [Haloarcula argentinensis]|uniref:Probable cobyric acid synthase n=1 Tax=Haloarcula argentinensis TaxID=43776 RepID=A0A847UJG4_HALAR|nr:cobyric acid synthase [Haloarcula argentinensis]NLV13669.1 cobyric acid synthase [Haloarcula argentinensis]
MAHTLLVAGTASHVGKSTVAAGLCRYLADCGVSVAPFKAQNMSNNARATPGGEVGVSQYVQARGAGVAPSTDHNPVLLKPRGDGESQLILDGEAVGHFEARGYYDEHWGDALETARAAHDRLAQSHDVIVAEGAGSIAEINLHDRDLANVETARFADADILLVADIERGGVFASLVGTLELVPDDIRGQVAGAVITKFRGDRSLLEPGIDEFEDRTGVPVLGVIPYDDPGLPEEDSVALPPVGERSVVGDDDGVPDEESTTVAVPRLPRISNFTDLQPLAREPGVRVAYIPPDAALADADAVVLPGSKNTVDDLQELTNAGFGDRLRAFDGPIVGLCGGYQMLGEAITNAAIEGTGDADRVEGLGLLPVTTAFSESKTVEHVERTLDGVGPLSGASGTVEGYEIHMGDSTLTGEATRPFDSDGAATGSVLGTYLHDLFVNDIARDAFVRNTFESAGMDLPAATERADGDPYERAAGLIDDHVDLGPLGLPDR